MSENTVTFRDVPGYPGYRVGDDGSVWSCRKHWGLAYNKGTTSYLSNTWRKLKPGIGSAGHLIVTLCPGRHTRSVHQLVLEAFVGPCPPGMQCRHFPDRNPANNHLSNLQWGTPKQNAADRVIHGTNGNGRKRIVTGKTWKYA